MFKANCKATLKALMRHPAIIIAFCAVILNILINNSVKYDAVDDHALFNHIYSISSVSTWSILFPPFLGVIIASNLLSERDTNFCDVLFASNMTFIKFVSSKIIAIFTVAVVAHFLYYFAYMLDFWIVQITSTEGFDIGYGFLELAWRYLLQEVVYLPLSLIVATSIGFFAVGITGVPLMSAVSLLGYVFLENIFPIYLVSTEAVNGLGGVLYYIPRQMMLYICAVTSPIPTSLRLKEYAAYNSLYVTPEKAIFSIVFHYVFSILLLVISYFLLRKRYNIAMPIKSK